MYICKLLINTFNSGDFVLQHFRGGGFRPGETMSRGDYVVDSLADTSSGLGLYRAADGQTSVRVLALQCNLEVDMQPARSDNPSCNVCIHVRTCLLAI